MRRLLAAALVLLALTGCAKRGAQLGAGEDVDFCAGWLEVDELDEPPLDERDEVLRWADGALRVIDRIDLRRKVVIDRRPAPVPADVRDRLAVVEQRLEVFREQVREAEGPDEDERVRRAVADLARTDFDATADELTKASGRLCPG